MARICGECLYIDFKNKESYTSRERYYCNELKKYVEKTDRGCSYYYYDETKKEKPSGGFTPSGCSFSVIIRDVLGFADDCELLNLLRSFRENVLKQNTEQYLPILLEYDQISPKISQCIQKDEDKQRFCLEFSQNFLLPFVCAFKTNEIEDAVSIYKNMFNALKERFGFSNTPIDLNATYDFETLGKARIRQPKTSEA